jgi:hypothetical protein
MLESIRGHMVVVILNDGLEEIVDMAFFCCESLHRIVIPDAVKTIKVTAFCECSRLTTVTLGDGLEDIGGSAFGYCVSLEHIVIPNAVKNKMGHSIVAHV